MSERKGALSGPRVSPHGHTIEGCPEHKTVHCTRCCGARAMGVATTEPFCGFLFPVGNGDALYCNREKGHIGFHMRLPWGRDD